MNIEIEKLHKVQLEILKSFDSFCHENNIKYQLSAGTLLGAIRHKGFIPWDDDVDIRMIRSEYEKFIKLSHKSYPKKYFIQTSETDSNYVHSFARIHKTDTTLIQKGWTHIDMFNGIFIDIFPFDLVPKNYIKRTVQYHSVFILQKLRMIARKKKYDYDSILNVIKDLLRRTCNLVPMTKYISLETKLIRIFSNENDDLTTCFVDGGKSTYKRLLINKGEFDNSISHQFENEHFFVPKNYDLILKKAYGDYMALPKHKNRKPHHGIIYINYDENVNTSILKETNYDL